MGSTKNLADLWKEAGKLEEEGEDVAKFNESVAKLPYQLKDEFRQRQDPKLDEQINRLQSDTFGAAIKGLDMYKDISDPFARRNLAEMYQGGIESQWKNAVDERTRRQGVFADYIEKWTGLFGAEAARKQQIFENKQATWDREKNLADTEESNRRWEIENARAERNSAKASQKDWTDQEVRAFVMSHKDDMTWEDQKQYLGSKGVDITQGRTFDIIANVAYGTGNYPLVPKEDTDAERSEKAYNELKRKATNNEEDFYWSGTKVKKKKKGLFNWDWLAADETVKNFNK
jgi:hypothetical protein